MGKTNKSGLGIGVGSSPQGSITQTEFDNKAKELLKKDEILKLLIDACVKFNANDVLFVTKDKDNQIVWLEKGNNGAGLTHILNKHANHFLKMHNVSNKNIPGYINDIITKGSIEYSRILKKENRDCIEKLYSYNGKHYLLTGIGTNGFIVSEYPVNEKKAKKLKERYK